MEPRGMEHEDASAKDSYLRLNPGANDLLFV